MTRQWCVMRILGYRPMSVRPSVRLFRHRVNVVCACERERKKKEEKCERLPKRTDARTYHFGCTSTKCTKFEFRCASIAIDTVHDVMSDHIHISTQSFSIRASNSIEFKSQCHLAKPYTNTHSHTIEERRVEKTKEKKRNKRNDHQ